MIELVIKWVALTVGFWAAAALLPGIKIKGGAGGHFIVAAIFGTLSFFLGNLLYTMIGLGTFFIGFVLAFLTRLIVGTILLIVTDKLTDKLSINRASTAFLAALVVAIVGSAT